MDDPLWVENKLWTWQRDIRKLKSVVDAFLIRKLSQKEIETLPAVITNAQSQIDGFEEQFPSLSVEKFLPVLPDHTQAIVGENRQLILAIRRSLDQLRQRVHLPGSSSSTPTPTVDQDHAAFALPPPVKPPPPSGPPPSRMHSHPPPRFMEAGEEETLMADTLRKENSLLQEHLAGHRKDNERVQQDLNNLSRSLEIVSKRQLSTSLSPEAKRTSPARVSEQTEHVSALKLTSNTHEELFRLQLQREKEKSAEIQRTQDKREEELSATLRNAEMKIAEMQREMATVAAESARVSSDRDRVQALLNETLSSMANKSSQWNDELSKLQTDKDLHAGVIASLQSEKVKLEGELLATQKSLQAKQNEWETEKITLSARIDTYESELRRERVAHQLDIQASEEMLSAFRHDIDKLEEDRSAVVEQLNKSQTERSVLASQADQNSSALDSAMERSSHLLDAIKDNEEALSNAQAEADKWRLKCGKSEDEVARLTAQSEILEQTNQKLQSENENLKSSTDQYRANESTALRDKHELSQRLEEMQRELSQVQAKEQSATEALVALRDCIPTLATTLSKQSSKAGKSDDLVEASKTLAGEVEGQDKTIRMLQQSLDGMRDQISSLQEENQSLTSMAMDDINSIRENEAKKIASLEEQVAHLIDERQLNAHMRVQLEQELHQARITISNQVSTAEAALKEKESALRSKEEAEIQGGIRTYASIEQTMARQQAEAESVALECARLTEKNAQLLLALQKERTNNLLLKQGRRLHDGEGLDGNANDQLAEELSALRKQFSSDLEVAYNNLSYIKGRYTNFESSREVLVSKLEAQLAEKDEKLLSLESQLRQGPGGAEKESLLKEELEATKSALHRLQEEEERLRKGWADGSSTYEQRTAVIQTQLRGALDELNSQAEAVAKLCNHVQPLQTELRDLKMSLNERDETMERSLTALQEAHLKTLQEVEAERVKRLETVAELQRLQEQNHRLNSSSNSETATLVATLSKRERELKSVQLALELEQEAHSVTTQEAQKWRKLYREADSSAALIRERFEIDEKIAKQETSMVEKMKKLEEVLEKTRREKREIEEELDSEKQRSRASTVDEVQKSPVSVTKLSERVHFLAQELNRLRHLPVNDSTTNPLNTSNRVDHLEEQVADLEKDLRSYRQQFLENISNISPSTRVMSEQSGIGSSVNSGGPTTPAAHTMTTPASSRRDPPGEASPAPSLTGQMKELLENVRQTASAHSPSSLLAWDTHKSGADDRDEDMQIGANLGTETGMYIDSPRVKRSLAHSTTPPLSLARNIFNTSDREGVAHDRSPSTGASQSRDPVALAKALLEVSKLDEAHGLLAKSCMTMVREQQVLLAKGENVSEAKNKLSILQHCLDVLGHEA